MYNQYLGTVLQAMGLAPGEYEQGGVGGYGLLLRSTESWYGGYRRYAEAVFAAMGEPLPWLRRG
jgi:hypothetical protein